VNNGLVMGLFILTHPYVPPMEHVWLLTLVLVIMDTLVTSVPNGTVSVTNVVATERVMHLISVGVTQGSITKTVVGILVLE